MNEQVQLSAEYCQFLQYNILLNYSNIAYHKFRIVTLIFVYQTIIHEIKLILKLLVIKLINL